MSTKSNKNRVVTGTRELAITETTAVEKVKLIEMDEEERRWLEEHFPHQEIQLDGFVVIKANRERRKGVRYVHDPLRGHLSSLHNSPILINNK